MFNKIFGTVMGTSLTPGVFFACTGVSLVLGLALAASFMYRSRYSRSFVTALALLPVIVQVVMMLVNGNLGTGVAVMGAFSLVRFRSVPGTAREIIGIFTAMAVGLAAGVGYIGVAAVFTAVIILMSLLYTASGFGSSPETRRRLKITIPESLDYTEVFDDIFERFTAQRELVRVKTSNMGSLYQLTYDIRLNNSGEEKSLIDELRCRNGNLDIVSSRQVSADEEL